MMNNHFFEHVYEVTRKVPFGRVTTYGAIARYLGAASSARMVGWALNSAHGKEPFVPAHRVVNRNGILSGKHHFGGQNVMKELLESEGIRVVDDRVVDFEQLCWEPIASLGL